MLATVLFWPFAPWRTDAAVNSLAQSARRTAPLGAVAAQNRTDRRSAARVRSGERIDRLYAPPIDTPAMRPQARMLVVCVAFAGQEQTQPISTYQRLYFGARDSVAAYYRAVSYGQFQLAGSVIGDPLHPGKFLELPHTEAYYAGTDNGSGSPYPNNDDGMVADTISRLVADHFNFTPYAAAGQIPYFALVFTGFGADVDSSDPKLIWPVESSLAHALRVPLSGALRTAGSSDVHSAAVATLSNYDLVPELSDQSGDPSTLGVYAHEFGHLLGLDDMYDTSGSANAGQGDGPWSLMANGNWNGYPQGSQPAELDVFSRMFLGWLHPTPVTQSVTGATLPPIEKSPSAYIITARGSAEYFLIDNVQSIGFDAGLPEFGVLIWHIDGRETVPSSADWVNNVLNTPKQNQTHHDDIAIVEAGGKAVLSQPSDIAGQLDDTYPGANGNNAWTLTSDPASVLWDGRPVGVDITNISVSKAGVATFDIRDYQSGSSLVIARPASGLTVEQGRSLQLVARYQTGDGTAQTVTAKAAWSLQTQGDKLSGSTLTFITPGPVTVSAAYRGLTALIHFTVLPRVVVPRV